MNETESAFAELGKSIIIGNTPAWIKVCENACDRATLAPTRVLSEPQPWDMRQIYGCHHNEVMREGLPEGKVPF